MKYNNELLNKMSEIEINKNDPYLNLENFVNTFNPIKYKHGGGIHIKEKNKGKFTASAKRAGKSVQEYAKDVLNDPNATALQKRRANFARNSKKWHKK